MLTVSASPQKGHKFPRSISIKTRGMYLQTALLSIPLFMAMLPTLAKTQKSLRTHWWMNSEDNHGIGRCHYLDVKCTTNTMCVCIFTPQPVMMSGNCGTFATVACLKKWVSWGRSWSWFYVWFRSCALYTSWPTSMTAKCTVDSHHQGWRAFRCSHTIGSQMNLSSLKMVMSHRGVS